MPGIFPTRSYCPFDLIPLVAVCPIKIAICSRWWDALWKLLVRSIFKTDSFWGQDDVFNSAKKESVFARDMKSTLKMGRKLLKWNRICSGWTIASFMPCRIWSSGRDFQACWPTGYLVHCNPSNQVILAMLRHSRKALYSRATSSRWNVAAWHGKCFFCFVATVLKRAKVIHFPPWSSTFPHFSRTNSQ